MIYLKIALFLKNNWKEICYIVFGIFAIFLIIPIFTSSSFLPEAEDSDIQRYSEVASELGLDWKDLVAFDMVLHDHDLRDRDPNEAAYYFISLHYEEFIPAHESCSKDKDGKESCSTVPEQITYSTDIKGENIIKSFFSQHDLTDKDIYNNIVKINSTEGRRAVVNPLSAEEAMNAAGFDKDMKEHFNAILESEILEQLFPQFEQGYINSGAVCSVSGELDEQKFNEVVTKAGVLSSKGEVIKKIAKDQGIDPVLMIAIIVLETGWGTSSAVVEHNNPAGLMVGSTILTYPTLDAGLKAQGKTLHKLIIDKGLTSIEKLGTSYAPIGADNDPNNLNANWVPTVTSIVKQAGGLTMNCTANDNLSIDVGPNGKMNYFDNVINIMLKFNGDPYVWGGANPSRGFDCSGLMQWSFGQLGINLPRTAQQQYNATIRISPSEAKAGDLVFFRGTYGPPTFVSHVGIYIGNGVMYNSQGKGIGYAKITSKYWAKYSPEFGRIK